MTITTYIFRGLGGKNLGVIYDNVAGTLSVLGQSITIASLSTAL